MPADSTTLLICDKRNSLMLGLRTASFRTSVAYSAYGARRRQALVPALGFSGQQVESFTECYALGHGHRIYNPSLRRFHSPDRLSPFDKGGLNAYAYCLGDPVNNEDPSGQFGRRIFSGLVNTAAEYADRLRNYFRWIGQAPLDELVDNADHFARVALVSSNVTIAGVLLGSPAIALSAGTVAASSLTASTVFGFGGRVAHAALSTGRVARELSADVLASAASLQQRSTTLWSFPARRRSSINLPLSTIDIRR